MTRPGDGPFTERTPRVAAARALTRRPGRDKAGRFLAEGTQAVREALHWAAAGRGRVHDLFVTGDLPADLASLAEAAGVRVSTVTDRAAASLSETVTPQGLVAVCDLLDVPLADALTGSPRPVDLPTGDESAGPPRPVGVADGEEVAGPSQPLGQSAGDESARRPRSADVACGEEVAGPSQPLDQSAGDELAPMSRPMDMAGGDAPAETRPPVARAGGTADAGPLASLSGGDARPGGPRLVVVLVGVSDPGNAGTVIRVADAAGADAVILAGDAVDPHNGKCVRASTGSLFHLPIVRERSVFEVLSACRAAGLVLVAADGHASADLDSAALAGPTAWVFGSEAHGLPAEVLAGVDKALRVPIYGAAESLNLATAAAVCLYATAWRQRGVECQ